MCTYDISIATDDDGKQLTARNILFGNKLEKEKEEDSSFPENATESCGNRSTKERDDTIH